MLEKSSSSKQKSSYELLPMKAKNAKNKITAKTDEEDEKQGNER